MSIQGITLTNFRNHQEFTLSVSTNFVIISGPNGSGKTNILEALSLFSPGKGLRTCNFDEVFCQHSNYLEWAVRGEINLLNDTINISTGCTSSGSGNVSRRIIKFNDEICNRHAEVLNYIKIIWLTPQTDRIFLEAPGIRRKFLDRLTYNFFPYHAQDIINYEKLTKSRLKVIQETTFDELWISTLEKQIAALNYKIATSRTNCLNLINENLLVSSSPFLKPCLSLSGSIYPLINENEKESITLIQHKLKLNRRIDGISGRTNLGIHKSDLEAFHPEKKIKADLCSTGEQKAMLISIIIAQVKAIKSHTSTPVVLLLDEIFSHLDNTFSANLIKELITLNTQIWITTTNDNLYSKIDNPYTVVKL